MLLSLMRGASLSEALRSKVKRSPAKHARAIKPHAEKAAQLLKALANEQRLMILCNLLEGPLLVGELNERLDLSQSALSQHLAVLRELKVVVTTSEAQNVRYSLPEGVVTQIIAVLYKEFCEG